MVAEVLRVLVVGKERGFVEPMGCYGVFISQGVNHTGADVWSEPVQLFQHASNAQVLKSVLEGQGRKAMVRPYTIHYVDEREKRILLADYAP